MDIEINLACFCYFILLCLLLQLFFGQVGKLINPHLPAGFSLFKFQIVFANILQVVVEYLKALRFFFSRLIDFFVKSLKRDCKWKSPICYFLEPYLEVQPFHKVRPKLISKIAAFMLFEYFWL